MGSGKGPENQDLVEVWGESFCYCGLVLRAKLGGIGGRSWGGVSNG